MSRIRQYKVTAPSNPPTNAMEMYYDSATSKPTFIDQSGNILRLGGFATKDYRLIKVTEIFQGTVSYTPTTGALALFVECVGGGASGGGCGTAATNAAAAGGGGGGAYSALFTTSIKTFTVAVGAGGAAPSAGNNPGLVGGDTTFDSPSICTAKGGTGGLGVTVTAGPVIGGLGGAGGASASGVGDMKSDGSAGGYGVMLAAAQAASGNGGDSALMGGGAVGRASQGNGSTGGLYGGGGSGACILSGGASTAGGAGGNGIIRVWEMG